MSEDQPARAIVYEVVPDWSRWELPEYGLMPRSLWHNTVQRTLSSVFRAYAQRAGRDVAVLEETAVRWRKERPTVGVDPDVAWVEPAPPEGARLQSVLTWKPGHHPPRVVVEVVSPTNPYKDYEIAPDRYSDLGVDELWVFDPGLEGPRAAGGPFKLQVWRRDRRGFHRVHAGDGPVKTKFFGAWLVLTEERQMLRVSDDPFGTKLWPTLEEAALALKEEERIEKEREREAKEREREAKERERAGREAAEAELTALRAELAKLKAAKKPAKKRRG